MNVLIAGGGIAGNALALQLARIGLRPEVVERAAAPRPGGQAVDLRGPSEAVAQRMGIMPGIRAHQLDERGMAWVDGRGRELSAMPVELLDGKGGIADIEITRGDLNQVLLDAAAETGAVTVRYGDHITAIGNSDTGVDVTFASGTNKRYDIVVGADGVHSSLRALAFGPEEDYTTFLGGYMSFFTVPTPPGQPAGWFRMHLVPGGAWAGLRADADPATSKAILCVRSDRDPSLRRDPAAQRAFIRERFEGAAWEVPAILERLDTADDLYFDELKRVELPRWSTGRVVLLGDAAYCGSPLTGRGTAMALVGAYILAGELAKDLADPDGAFDRYETTLRAYVTKAQELPPGGIRMTAPKTRVGIRLGLALNKLMTTRLLRPLLIKMLSESDDFDLPTYGGPVLADVTGELPRHRGSFRGEAGNGR